MINYGKFFPKIFDYDLDYKERKKLGCKRKTIFFIELCYLTVIFYTES